MSVLEGDCRLVRQGLEESQVVVTERGALGEAIGHPKGAD